MHEVSTVNKDKSTLPTHEVSEYAKDKSFYSLREEKEEEEGEEAYYSDSDSFVTIDTDSDTIENSGDSDSAIGSESFCVNPFFN
jgi:hypothetical protein